MDVSDRYLEWIAATRSKAAEDVRFGIVAIRQGDNLNLAVRFLSGQSYCCMEPGCHFGLHSPSAWATLGSYLGFDVLVVNLTAIVEKGSVFTGKAASAAQEYNARFSKNVG